MSIVLIEGFFLNIFSHYHGAAHTKKFYFMSLPICYLLGSLQYLNFFANILAYLKVNWSDFFFFLFYEIIYLNEAQ